MSEEKKWTLDDVLEFIEESVKRYPESQGILETVKYRVEKLKPAGGETVLRHCDSLDLVIPLLEIAIVGESGEEQSKFLRETLDDIKELKKDLKCGAEKIG